jgi:hypothetical protein
MTFKIAKRNATVPQAVGKTYTEQILEPSQVYEFHGIFKANVKNMIIILFHTEH